MEPTTAPPVVIVIVACDPGSWFEETLASVASQDYPNLSVLVIDVASEADPTGRVANVLPGAFVRRLTQRMGFGRAANDVLEVVDGASHFLFCHDDVALAPDAVRLMVEESFRSNSGIVSPKLVEWARPEHLIAVGAGADRVGVIHPLLERGELDQAQHDGVREVFVAPGGATLVRADLFSTLGGFGQEIAECGEDLDLSWRVQIAGALVVVAPDARVRHLEATERGLRPGTASVVARRRARNLIEAHRIRTVLTCYGAFHLLWMVPLTVGYALGEAGWQLLCGRPGDGGDTRRSCVDGFGRPRGLWRARREVQSHRRVPDREVVRLQSRGNARLRAYIRERVEGGPDSGLSPTPVGANPWRLPLGAALVVVALIVVGSRGLLRASIPAVGSLPSGGGGLGHWWDLWWSTWRGAGLGTTGPGPPGLGLLAALGTVFGGALGTVQHVVVLGPLLLGPLGAYRAARPWGSLRGRVAAMVVYATVPVAFNALAQGRWGGLIVYAGAP
ncbi:MAG: glycosyltransferase, partial [Acidimicrobiales bacterium]